MDQPEPHTNLKLELDRCVKCGMCLPECPTYRLTTDENESPRGRLALIEGWVDGRLPADDRLKAHLDTCLTCRRCERVCPSQVRYGLIIDQARANMRQFSSTLLDALVRKPNYLRVGTKFAQALPLATSTPFGKLHLMHQMAHALPSAVAPPAPGEYPTPTTQARGRVGLFLGCATSVQQTRALYAALRLLQYTGYTVIISGNATCCGAMAQHHGDTKTVKRLADTNRQAFDKSLDAVVSIASGCGTHLDGLNPGLPAPHYDICDFLLTKDHLNTRHFKPFPHKVLLHTPCTVENLYRGAHWAGNLLAMIPELVIESIGEPGQCCGSAGDYMFRHRETAIHLRQPILEYIKSSNADTLLTSNIGCALHIAQGLMEQGRRIDVLHPIEILYRQLKD